MKVYIDLEFLVCMSRRQYIESKVDSMPHPTTKWINPGQNQQCL